MWLSYSLPQQKQANHHNKTHTTKARNPGRPRTLQTDQTGHAPQPGTAMHRGKHSRPWQPPRKTDHVTCVSMFYLSEHRGKQ